MNSIPVIPTLPEVTSLTFNAVKVFSASMHVQRRALGDVVNQWLAEHPTFRVHDFVVTQSSDAGYHCLSICVFYRDSSHSELGALPACPRCGA
jgi:hypothetical protein